MYFFLNVRLYPVFVGFVLTLYLAQALGKCQTGGAFTLLIIAMTTLLQGEDSHGECILYAQVVVATADALHAYRHRPDSNVQEWSVLHLPVAWLGAVMGACMKSYSHFFQKILVPVVAICCVYYSAFEFYFKEGVSQWRARVEFLYGKPYTMQQWIGPLASLSRVSDSWSNGAVLPDNTEAAKEGFRLRAHVAEEKNGVATPVSLPPGKCPLTANRCLEREQKEESCDNNSVASRSPSMPSLVRIDEDGNVYHLDSLEGPLLHPQEGHHDYDVDRSESSAVPPDLVIYRSLPLSSNPPLISKCDEVELIDFARYSRSLIAVQDKHYEEENQSVATIEERASTLLRYILLAVVFLALLLAYLLIGEHIQDRKYGTVTWVAVLASVLGLLVQITLLYQPPKELHDKRAGGFYGRIKIAVAIFTWAFGHGLAAVDTIPRMPGRTDVHFASSETAFLSLCMSMLLITQGLAEGTLVPRFLFMLMIATIICNAVAIRTVRWMETRTLRSHSLCLLLTGTMLLVVATTALLGGITTAVGYATTSDKDVLPGAKVVA